MKKYEVVEMLSIVDILAEEMVEPAMIGIELEEYFFVFIKPCDQGQGQFRTRY